jgi:hypothetical protein
MDPLEQLYPASDYPCHEMTPANPTAEPSSVSQMIASAAVPSLSFQGTSLSSQDMVSPAVPSFSFHEPSSSSQHIAAAAAPSLSLQEPSSFSQKMASAPKSYTSQVPPLKVFTANHDDGEDLKRFGFKAPTIAAWLEIYMQDTMPDSVVGILLNLTPYEVEKLKSRIHKIVRSPVLPPGPSNALISLKRDLTCKDGDACREDYKRHNKLSNLARSCYATSVGLEFPHLFREPASHREFKVDWTENEFGCYSIVPWSFRRDILDRLIGICLEEREKEERASTSGPVLHDKRPKPGHEESNTPNKRSRIETVLSGGLGHELLGPGVGHDRSAK